MTDEVRSTVRNGDIELAVFTSGNPDGPTLVLVHGWPDTHVLWQHVRPHLVDRFRVVTYDSRGAGESTVPTDNARYLLTELADDLRAVIDAVSPGTPVHVLGHDWGAVETWEAAADPAAAQRIKSYTSVSGPNLDHLGQWVRARLRRPSLRGIGQVLAQFRASWYTVTFQSTRLARMRIDRQYGRGWGTFLQEFSNVDPSMVTPSDTLYDDAVNGVRLYQANLVSRLTRPGRKFVDVPVQLIVNTEDIAVRPFHYDDTHRWVRDLRRTDIAAGHWSPLSHGPELARITAAFVDEIEAREA